MGLSVIPIVRKCDRVLSSFPAVGKCCVGIADDVDRSTRVYSMHKHVNGDQSRVDDLSDSCWEMQYLVELMIECFDCTTRR